ncbi:low-density lipoprotein receptor-related protein 4-like [Argopecten irradians]|uniref:low-density lipoprotein receptor-related protein 4-like n=1 Tax=Argopecten irradians TaxID=31199 RepID=UPI0037202FB8
MVCCARVTRDLARVPTTSQCTDIRGEVRLCQRTLVMESVWWFLVLWLSIIFTGVLTVLPPGQKNETGACEHDQVKCHDGSLCISKTSFCDRKIDCPDQSDERLCVIRNCTSQSDFPCSRSEECVSRDFVCDGISDCRDGSDELVCDPKENCSLDHDRFLCSDRKVCLLSKKVCNGQEDCRDGSDESLKCESAKQSCEAGRCGEFGVCKALPHGPVCTCQLGYKLMTDNITCKDIDECVITRQGRSPCQHTCTNTNGSFTCSCLPGYRLENNTNCKVQDPDPVLYVAANTGALGYHIRTERWVTVLEHQPDIQALDFGPNNILYWTAVSKSSDVVQFGHVGQPGNDTTHTLLDIGLSNPKGVAVDWMTHAVYLVSQDSGQIIACGQTPPIRCVIIKEDLDELQDIIICHHFRRLFWTTWGLTPKISSSDMDGRNTTLVIGDRLKHPTGLVMDRPRNRLLWADTLLHRIESSDMDGSNRRIVVSRGVLYPSSLTVLEGTLYWANTYQGSLSSCNWYQGCSDIVHLQTGLHHPNSLVIGSPSLHGLSGDSVVNLCQDSPCSHLCLSSQSGYRCMCPPDQVITKDDHTCSGRHRAKKIYIASRGQILMLPLGQPGYTRDLLLPANLAPGSTPTALDVDLNTNTVVYCDSVHSTITKATTDVNTNKVIENTLYNSDSIQHVLDVGVDWRSGNIYWTDVSKATIMVGHVSGEHLLTLLKDGLDHPNSLDIDHVHGYVYFSDVGDSPFIGRCRLDGSEFTKLDIDVGHTDHLKVSSDKDHRLYFVDDQFHQIISVSLPNGTDYKTHWQGVTGHVLGLAVTDQWIYWTDQQSEGSGLCRVHKNDYNKETCYLRNSFILKGLAIPSPISTPQVVGCGIDNGGCGHFCFNKGSDVICKCPNGFQLQEDGRSCQAAPDPKCVFRCRDGHCITDQSYLCDGQPDCPEGEEEDLRLCGYTSTPLVTLSDTACQEPNPCQHLCKKTPQGPRCECRHGYELSSDQQGCRDIDECTTSNGGCSQVCHNQDDGHTCSCVGGYTKNGSLCFAEDPRPYLVIGGTGGIDKVNDQGQTEELMTGEASGFVTALDVVMETGDIIFVTSVHQALFLYKRTEKHVTPLTSLSSTVTALSYDWIGRNVYYTDDRVLAVCSVKSKPVLCRTLRYEPVGSIALHPKKGCMLWTSAADGTIMRMAMDGGNLTVVVKVTVGQSIQSLTIDYATDRIYWITSPANLVWSSDMEGRKIQKLPVLGNGHHFSSLAVFENTLYLLEKRSKVGYLYSKTSGEQTSVVQLVSTPSCLRVVHPYQQPHQVTDVCRNKDCSHLCLVSPRGGNCYCPDGLQFLQDSLKTCTTEENPKVPSGVKATISSLETEALKTEVPYKSGTTTTKPVRQKSQTKSYNVRTTARLGERGSRTTLRPAAGNPKVDLPAPIVVNISQPKIAPPIKVHMKVQHVAHLLNNQELCEIICENGGSCVISEDTKRRACRCAEGYSGATCGDLDAASQGETTSDKNQSITIGVSLAVAVTAVLVVVILVACWIRKRTGRPFPNYMPCISRPNKVLKVEDDAEGLVADSSFGDLRFGSDVTFREFDSVSYQTTSSSTDGNNNTGNSDKYYDPHNIHYCPSNQSFGATFGRQEEARDRSSSSSTNSSM